MSSLPGRRVGLAILRIEREDAGGGRVLVRVQTVDDVVDEERRSHERSFARRDEALAYLGDWLASWPDEGGDASVTLG